MILPQSLKIAGLSVLKTGESEKPLLNDVSLELKAGQTLALLGPSGSGKSLTCTASLGTLGPGLQKTSGKLFYNGQEIKPEDARGKLISLVMQNPASAFNPVYTMQQHADETLKALGRYASNSREELLSTLSEVGLEEPERVLGLYPFQMSGGMLQRMMIALALLSKAPFLFADEPTTDLDLLVQEKILNVLERVARDRHLGVLLVTHDLGVVARLAQEVAVIEQGKIVELLAIQKLFDSPEHPASRRLVNAHLTLYPEAWND